MNIGIIGAGSLGTAMAERLGAVGHSIMFGGGESAKLAAERHSVAFGSNAEAAAFGGVVVLAVPFQSIDYALADAQPLQGRILWSCVNALKPDLSGLAVGFDTSAAEEVARHAPGACVVAAVPPFADAIAGRRLSLVRDLGAHPVDAGPLRSARLVEPALMLLVTIAYAGVPRDVGLRLLER